VARSAEVTSRVRRALARGLSPSPEARFETMDALLAALGPPQRRSGVWRTALPLAAALAAAAVGWGLARGEREAAGAGTSTHAPARTEVVSLRVGERRQLRVADAVRVALGDPAVADVDGVSREGLWVEGRRAGGTTLLVWHSAGPRSTFRLQVVAP
jgi:hypothetical protein